MIDKQLLLAFFASSAVACAGIDGSDYAGSGAGVADRCVATDLATCRYTSELSFARLPFLFTIVNLDCTDTRTSPLRDDWNPNA